MHATHHVFYNDGQSEDNFAIYLGDGDAPGEDRLHVLEGARKGETVSAPRRDKKDYDQAGGGRTWHL